MPQDELSSYQVIAFDYNTLIDWETGVGEALVKYLEDIPSPPESPASSPSITPRTADSVPPSLSSSTADEDYDSDPGDYRPDPLPAQHQLTRRFLQHEASVRREQGFLDYFVVFEQSHYRLMAQDYKLWNSTTVASSRDFTDSIYCRWPAWPDTVTALRALRALGGFKLVLLSNLEEASVIERTLAGPLRDVAHILDGIYCANGQATYTLESVKEFDDVLDRVKSDFGIAAGQPTRLLYVARGLKHDLLGRHEAGIVSVRGEEAVDTIAADLFKDSTRHAWRFPTLNDFVEAVGTSLAHSPPDEEA